MKKLPFALFALCCGVLSAQSYRVPSINIYTGDPTGVACTSANSLVQSSTTGAIYSCLSGHYVGTAIATAGGTNTQIQYNNNGVLGGSKVTTNPTTGDIVTPGSVSGASVTLTDLTQTGQGMAAVRQPGAYTRYVGPASDGCSDANDGLTPGTCMNSYWAAHISLMIAHPGFGGQIQHYDGAVCSAAPYNADNTYWVAGPWDSQWGVATASASGNTLTVTAISNNPSGGQPAIQVGGSITSYSSNIPYAMITAFGTGTGGVGTYTLDRTVNSGSVQIDYTAAKWLPQTRITVNAAGGHYTQLVSQGNATLCSGTLPDLWFSGTNVPINFNNQVIEAGTIPLQIGFDSANDGSSSNTQGIHFKESTIRLLPTQPTTAGPAINIGNNYSFDCERCSIGGNSSTGRPTDGSDASEALVAKAGGVCSSGGLRIVDSIIYSGDIKVYDAPANAAGPLPSCLYLRNVSGSSTATPDGKGLLWLPAHYSMNVLQDGYMVAAPPSTAFNDSPAVEIDSDSNASNESFNYLQGQTKHYTATTFSSGVPTLTVTSATGIQLADVVQCTGVPLGSTVTAIAGTTITISGNTTSAQSGITCQFARWNSLTTAGAVPSALGQQGYVGPNFLFSSTVGPLATDNAGNVMTSATRQSSVAFPGTNFTDNNVYTRASYGGIALIPAMQAGSPSKLSIDLTKITGLFVNGHNLIRQFASTPFSATYATVAADFKCDSTTLYYWTDILVTDATNGIQPGTVISSGGGSTRVLISCDALNNQWRVTSLISAAPTNQGTPVRAGTWSISAATSVAVTFATSMGSTPDSCSVTPSASAATTGTPFVTSKSSSGFTVNVPTSGTLAGTYLCASNNTN